MSTAFAAVDIGNSGLRVMLGRMSGGRLIVDEVARHPNAPYLSSDGWRWKVQALRDGMVRGLNAADRIAPLSSIGIDTRPGMRMGGSRLASGVGGGQRVLAAPAGNAVLASRRTSILLDESTDELALL